MRLIISILTIQFLSLNLFANDCKFPENAKNGIVNLEPEEFTGNHIMFKCNADGSKSDSGQKVCIQYFGVVAKSFSSANTLHGSVLILDESTGELTDTKKLYIGTDSKAPEGTVGFVNNGKNIQELRESICKNWTPMRSRKVDMSHLTKPFCMCGKKDSRWKSKCENYNPENDIYDLYRTGANFSDGHVAFSSPPMLARYTALSGSYRDRLFDAVNGMVPIGYCSTKKNSASYNIIWAAIRADSSSEATQKCYNDLNPTVSNRMVETASSVYNTNIATESEGSIGGTYSQIITLVSQARIKMGGCFPENPKQRGSYLGEVRSIKATSTQK